MSRVFEARRADGAFEQRAALELLREPFPSPESVARSRLDLQLLADRGPDHEKTRPTAERLARLERAR